MQASEKPAERLFQLPRRDKLLVGSYQHRGLNESQDSVGREAGEAQVTRDGEIPCVALKEGPLWSDYTQHGST